MIYPSSQFSDFLKNVERICCTRSAAESLSKLMFKNNSVYNNDMMPIFLDQKAEHTDLDFDIGDELLQISPGNNLNKNKS